MKKKLHNRITYFPFILLGIIIIYLIINSFIGKTLQNSTDIPNLYTSTPLLFLWGLLGVTGMVVLLRNGDGRKMPLLLFHCSLILILLGACVTHFTHESGILHLRKGVEKNKFVSFQENRLIKLPFYLSLSEFNVINYPGTTTPADYKSIVQIQKKQKCIPATISMNKILNIDGYRFYQTSYDEDLMGTILTVTYDKWGVRITYIGYGLLFFSMFLLLLAPKGKFRHLLKDKRWKMLSVLLLFMTIPNQGWAKTKTLSDEELAVFGQILIQHQGRISTMENFASDFTKKITGKSSYKEYSALEVLCGWIFAPEIWQNEPMFKIKGKYEQNVLGITSDYAKFTDYFNNDVSYKIEEFMSQPATSKEKEKRWKKLSIIDEKAQLIFMLHSGELIKIFPINNRGNIELLSSSEAKSYTLNSYDSLLTNHFIPLLYESIQKRESCQVWIEQFKKHQLQKLGDNAPSAVQLKAEQLYLKYNILPTLGYCTLIIGFIAFVLLCLQLIGNRRFYRFQTLSIVFLLLSFAYLSFILSLRGIISERLPFSNGHETMLSIAWMAQLGALIARKKISIVIPMGILMSGFALLGATLSDSNPQITHLMPVLNSPLLSIHVSLMMISYTLIGFITIISLLSVILILFQQNNEAIQNLTSLNQLLLYPALFFMSAGIFIGAIWANVSWGNYWSWDPKETWALISMLYYSISMHNDSLPFLRKPHLFHLYLIIGAFLILTTYFGVNYYFGGMHSYA